MGRVVGAGRVGVVEEVREGRTSWLGLGCEQRGSRLVFFAMVPWTSRPQDRSVYRLID